MSFSLFYKKKTKELLVFYEDSGCDALCIVSIGNHPTAKLRIIGDKRWRTTHPECKSFSFDKTYYCFRSRKTPDSSDEYKYTDYKNVISCFFHKSLRQEELSLLDRYNFNLFLILLFIRKSSIHKLIESNAALALLLIHYNPPLLNRSDAFWANIREMAQLNPSQIIKKIYSLRTSRKAVNILQKIDTTELPNIEALVKLKSCLQDDMMLRLLEKTSKITYEILVIISERKNRSFINAEFLNSVTELKESPVSASFMLQWLRTNNIKIHFSLRGFKQLRSIYNYFHDQSDLFSMGNFSKQIPSSLISSDAIPVNTELLMKQDSQTNNPLKIPHKLETASDILIAMQHNVLGLGKETYQRLLYHTRKNLVIKKPTALLQAKPVSKDIFVLKERKTRQEHASYKQNEGLSSIGNFTLIEDQIPWLKELIKPECLNAYLTYIEGETNDESMNVDSFSLMKHLLLKEIIRRELRSLIQCNKTKSVPLKELKKLIVGYTLHESRNHDILGAIKIAQSNDNDVLFENCVTELFFSRIPRYIKSLFIDDPKIIPNLRGKLLSKIAKLGVPANVKMALFHLIPRRETRKTEDLVRITKKMLFFIQKCSLDEQAKKSLNSHMYNIMSELTRSESIYQKLFLPTKELEKFFSLYVPNNDLVTCNLSYTERIIREYCDKQAIYMYPSKDFLDLEKYRWSNDCSRDSLGVNQLRTPHFFNIRLFKDKQEFCGNIYMLQLEHDSKHYLLVDRIQTSTFSTRYALFYQILREAFLEMFEEFPFHEILLPNTEISNNKSLNQIFHSTKRDFPKKQIYFRLTNNITTHFDSLRNNEFRILCRKTIPSKYTREEALDDTTIRRKPVYHP